MSDTGLKYVTSAADNATVGTRTWSTVSNIIGNNTNDATAASVTGAIGNLTSHYLIGTFTTGLSAGDTITGIVGAFRRLCTDDNSDGPMQTNSVKWYNGSSFGTELATPFVDDFPLSGAWSGNFGTSSTTGGLTLTGASTIAMAVSGLFQGRFDTAKITAMRVTIYYTSGATGNPGSILLSI